ncbi:MAG: N-acetylmuramoyl-L-alanine amidase [Elusimicrobia bacterium]|nr:N-acetylmuramoyl-L-alanine amidase [Elusimicrobiota bacterium]
MSRRSVFAVLLFAAVFSGCDDDEPAPPVKAGGDAAAREASAPRAPGRDLRAYAPATDFSGASAEDAAARAGALFDGARAHDAVPADAPSSGPDSDGRRGKRLPYTAAESERISDLRGAAVPPAPENGLGDPPSAALPDVARAAGRTLLDFAAFQLEQKFPAAAPIMSRLGWRAAPRRGANQEHAPYRVTVHHTQGPRPMNEAQTAAAVRAIQRHHMVGRGREGKGAFEDIGYHFLIAGDGRVVEGRRAEYLGAHAGGANQGNIGVAMMGDFTKIRPTREQSESLVRLVTFLAVKYKKDSAAADFLEGHQHYNKTECPGRNLMAILESLRRKMAEGRGVILAGGKVGGDSGFTPLAVLGAAKA